MFIQCVSKRPLPNPTKVSGFNQSYLSQKVNTKKDTGNWSSYIVFDIL